MAKMTGTEVCICTETVSQVILNGSGENKNRTVFFWDLGVTQKLWTGAKLVVHTRGGTGRGPGHLIAGGGSPMLNINHKAGEPEAIYISHLFLEQKLFDNKLTVSAGKLDYGDFFDTNEAASWNFTSYALARNPLIPTPWHALGAVVRYDPTDWLYVQAGVFDAQASGTETGLNTAFHDEDYTVSMYEAGLRHKWGERVGNYRFILWYDPQPHSRIDGNGSERDDLGFALSFDQQVTDKITAFLRYGWANEHVRNNRQFWNVGFTWQGPIAARPADDLGFSVGQTITGHDYRKANGATSSETLFETYYRIRFTEWLALSPNVQVMIHPGASPDNDVAVMAGLRLTVEF
ncbi:MAG TPA: carbohydrate porin, partial [Phycisphaerae bacterium]|nr:carbohydrate porin [Phycisphaerae bacterium]